MRQRNARVDVEDEDGLERGRSRLSRARGAGTTYNPRRQGKREGNVEARPASSERPKSVQQSSQAGRESEEEEFITKW